MAPIPNEWFRPRGTLECGGWESLLVPDGAAWRYTGLRIAALAAGEQRTLPAADVERIVVPLAGSFTVDHGTVTRLSGRADVFTGPTDVLYLGPGTPAVLTGRGRVAVAEAPATADRPAVHLPADQVPLEIRGAGRDTRQVHNFGIPGVLDAQNLIVCEVITPGGNWSSHPAHKHDESRPGHESTLEEIYYFEAAPARDLAGLARRPSPSSPFGTFLTYSSPAGDIDTHATVRTGDIALVPFGYHGPATAPPEYDLYYLNVMAGPDRERCWLISDDPEQAWLRETWPQQQPDPRLPYSPPRDPPRAVPR